MIKTQNTSKIQNYVNLRLKLVHITIITVSYINVYAETLIDSTVSED